MRKKWQPTPAFLPGESHGQSILVGYRPCGRKESDITEVIAHMQVLKMKRQHAEWEKIFANEATDKKLMSKIYKQLT